MNLEIEGSQGLLQLIIYIFLRNQLYEIPFIMETMDYKDDQHYNSKQNTRDKERFERKQAWKKFKSLKQQLVDKHLEESVCSTESEIKNNSKPATRTAIYETERFDNIPLASITRVCLKSNDDSSLIRKIVKKRGKKLMCSKTLNRLENLGAFEYKGYELFENGSATHPSIKKMKYKEEYSLLTAKTKPLNCKKCKSSFHIDERPIKEFCGCIFGGKKIYWDKDKIISHWLEHKDAELAKIYAKDRINGIIELEEKRITDFFRHVKVLYSV